MSKVSPQQAAAELLARRKARASLLDYARYIDVPGAPVSEEPEEWIFKPVETDLAAHHLLVLQVLEKVMTGELPRAMLFLPPGSAKSTYGSVVAPSWAMGREPGTKIILTSYGGDLAKKHGRRARQICRDSKYRYLFGTDISKETSAADFWTLENGSEYMSGGILSGITGNRAHGLIIDDPVKGRQEADSEVTQKRTWEAYNDDLRTRLIPGGWEIIIQTRWSENDLSGKLLPEEYSGQTGVVRCRDGRDWYVVCLPAQHMEDYPADPLSRQPGEYLWPEWFTTEHFEGFKANRRTWNALFQQRPSDDQGGFFKRDWFGRYRVGSEPERMHKYLTSDHAPGGQDHNDHNTFRLWGVDDSDRLWLLGGFRSQETLDKSIDRVLTIIKHQKPLCWFPEDDNNWKSIAGFVNREMVRTNRYCRIEPVSPHGKDKPTKAQAFQARAAAGMVFLPDTLEGDEILNQYVKFPAGAHDDEVDAAGVMGRVLDEAHPAIAPAKKEPVKTQAQEDWNRVIGSPVSRGIVKDYEGTTWR